SILATQFEGGIDQMQPAVGSSSGSTQSGGVIPPPLASPQPRSALAHSRPDLLQVSVFIMILVSVWRIQDLLPILNTVKISYISPGLAVLAFVADHDPRRAIRRIDSRILRALLGIVV